MKLRRLGLFSIPLKDIEETPDDIMELMGKLIVLKAELCYYTDTIDYVAHCNEFDVIQEGMLPLNYLIKFNNEKKLHFVKQIGI